MLNHRAERRLDLLPVVITWFAIRLRDPQLLTVRMCTISASPGSFAWLVRCIRGRQTGLSDGPFPAGEGTNEVVVVRVPRVMIQARIFEPDTWLLVQGALYGLRESRHSWGVSRDSTLSKLQWPGHGGRSLELSQCEADNFNVKDSRHSN